MLHIISLSVYNLKEDTRLVYFKNDITIDESTRREPFVTWLVYSINNNLVAR